MKISKTPYRVVLMVGLAFGIQSFAYTAEIATTNAVSDKVVLATPPVWFFNPLLDTFGGSATCLAVNLHRHPIKITIELIFHDDDSLPMPTRPDTLSGGKLTQVLQPGEATVVSDKDDGYGRSSDALLARCVFKYQGDKRKVKAAIVLEDGLYKTVTLPAELD